MEDPQARPTADRLVLDYFSGKGIILLILFYRHETVFYWKIYHS